MSTYFSKTAKNTVDKYAVAVADISAPATIMSLNGDSTQLPQLLSFHYNGHTYWNVEYLQQIKESKDNRIYKDWMEEILKEWSQYNSNHGNNAQ